MKQLKTIAFDADDTLWVNEPIYTKTQEKFKIVIQKYVPVSKLEDQLYQTEIKNLRLFGYGVKGFMLSMIETAIELSKGRITGDDIQTIIKLGKDMIDHPVEVLAGVKNTLDKLQGDYELMVITKGDLFDQESKIARSGLADYFNRVEILSEKNERAYRQVLSKNDIDLGQFLMIGNSLKSDVLPICKIGGQAVHIPFHTTWAHETVEIHHADGYDYYELEDISLVPPFLNKIKK